MAGEVLLRPFVALADNAGGAVDDVARLAGDDAARLNPFGLAPLVLDDVTVAAKRVDEEVIPRIESLIAQYGTGTLDDAQQAATKDIRIGVHRLNMEAQERLTKYVDDPSLVDATIAGRIQNADASLEDLGWQLARKASPDGRFNGIDLPGALRDGRTASTILHELAPLPSAADGVAPAVAAVV